MLEKHQLTQFTHNYLDDIMIHSRNIEEHIVHLEMVFQAMKEEKVKFKLSKCHIAAEKVEYLGHDISPGKIRPLKSHVVAIEKFPIPKDRISLQQLLGKINFNRKFIPNASKKLSPLFELLKDGKQFQWTDSCQKAFEDIKSILTSEPVLRIFNPNLPCYLFTDACKIGIGAILKQKSNDDEELLTVGYFSKKLLPYQRNYTISELECYAIVEALEYFHHYLYGSKFTVITDHQALKWLHKIKKPNSRLFKWALKLSQYDFQIQYRPGKDNIEADALSRNPVLEDFTHENHLNIINLIQKEELKTAQKEEMDVNMNHTLPHLRTVDGILVRKKGLFRRYYVPTSLRTKVVEKFHEKFGHIGIKKTLFMISKSYFWPNMTNEVKLFIDTCEICQKNKVRKGKEYGTLSITGPANNPFEIISIDTLCGFEGYGSNHKYFLLAIDNFTRFVWGITSKTQKTKDFRRLIELVLMIGKPKYILSDNFPSVCSNSFRSFLSDYDIGIKYISPDCHHSNGLIERANSTISERIRCEFNMNKRNRPWTVLAMNCLNQYNDSVHDTTKFSPRFLLT